MQIPPLVPLAAFTATGDLARLKDALHQALDAGLTIEQAKEAMVQLYAYCGFPRSLNALGVLMQTVQERRARGCHDADGRAATQLPPGGDMLARGTATQTRLAGAPVQGPLFDFAPAIDHYLKRHLFGDIFASDALTEPEREMVTIAALASLHGVDSQLAAHYRIGRNAGLSAAQLHHIVQVLTERVDAEAGRHAAAVLQDSGAA